MTRRTLISSMFAVTLSGHIAFAASFQETLVARLRSEGYTEIAVNLTLLGRAQIIAIGPSSRREIVLNPRTGEILRDFAEPFVATSETEAVPADQDVGTVAGSVTGGTDTTGTDGTGSGGTGSDGSGSGDGSQNDGSEHEDQPDEQENQG